MYYVYIIRSIAHPDQTYVGFTADLKSRIAVHSRGGSVHTAKYRPWKLIWYCAFPDKGRALSFEQYLKSHSGKAFTAKRLKPGS